MEYLAPVLTVGNLANSLRFYREVMGFDLWFEWGTTAGLVKGNSRLMLDEDANVACGDATLGKGVELYFAMGDGIDSYYLTVKDQVRVVSPLEDKPWGDRVFSMLDSDGYRLTFSQNKE